MSKITIPILTLLVILLLNTVPQGMAYSYELFVVGDEGTCYQNDGYEWRRISGILSPGIHRFWALSDDDIYAVAREYVYQYDEESWNKIHTMSEDVILTSIWCASESDIFVGGVEHLEGVMLHYNGVDWTETRYPESLYFRSISGSSASDVYAASQMKFLHFDGIGWSEVDLGDWSDEDLNWYAVWCNSPNDVYLAGYYYFNDDTCIILHYDGSGWAEVFTNDNLALTSLWMSNEGILYASGHTLVYPVQGKVVRYSGSWQIETFHDAFRLYSIHGNSSTDVYVVGEAPTFPDSGIVYHYDGSGWEVVPEFMDQECSSVHCVAEDLVLAGGEHGYVFRGNLLDWKRWIPEVATDFVGVWGTSTGNIYTVSNNGLIYYYNGISWNELTGPGYPIDKIWGLSANEIYAVCKDDGVFHYNGISWNRIFDEPANDIWGTSGTNLYVTNDRPNSYVKHYDGVEWTYVSVYPYYYNNLGVWGTPDDELFLVGDYEECDDPQMLCWFVPIFLHRDESGWECFRGGRIYEINKYYKYDVWGSSGDYVFSVGPQYTKLFDGETQTVIGPGGESVWSSGLEAWWTHYHWEDKDCVAHFDGVQTDKVYLNGCELHYVCGIEEPSSTVIVTVRTDPVGPEFEIDGTTFSASHSFGSKPGMTYEIGVESPQIGDEEYHFVEWNDGGDTVHAIVVPDTNVTYIAYFVKSPKVTVTTEPEGLDVIVAGTAYKSPYNFSMLSGTELEIGVVSPQWFKGTDLYFIEWSDGCVTRTRTVTLPDKDIVYTATFADVLTGDETEPLPLVNALHQNHPNPFNPYTTISFSVESGRHASLVVYDVAGRLVRMLIDGVVEAGPHDVTWDGKDNAGRGVTSGVYFYRLAAGEFFETKKMVLLR